MYAKDWNTKATVYESYSGEGTTKFIGSHSIRPDKYSFTGLMTEWYHVNPSSGGEQRVTYSNFSFPLSSAWMWMDEWDPSNPGWSGAWSDYTLNPVQYSSNPSQFQSFTSHTFTVASNAYEFVTGYTGEVVPVAAPYPLSMIMVVEITVLATIAAVGTYILIRRLCGYQEPASPKYAPPPSQKTLSYPNFCPICGTQLSSEEKFCHNCGRPVTL